MGGSVLFLYLAVLRFEEVYVERFVNLGFCNNKLINMFIMFEYTITKVKHHKLGSFFSEQGYVMRIDLINKDKCII